MNVFLFLNRSLSEDKDFLSCQQLAQLFAQPSSATGGQKERSVLSDLHFTPFLVSFCEKNGQIRGSGKTGFFFFFAHVNPDNLDVFY